MREQTIILMSYIGMIVLGFFQFFFFLHHLIAIFFFKLNRIDAKCTNGKTFLIFTFLKMNLSSMMLLLFDF